MSVPHNYEDSMRRHDAAVYSWLDGLRVDYGRINGELRNDFPILRVFAAPHRAFAQAYDRLVSMGWAAGGNDAAARMTAEADWTLLPLPFCTIDRDYPVMAPELAASALTYERTFRDPETGEWVQLPYPLHALTTYRLNFWSMHRYTEAYILEWFYSRFGALGAGNREVYLTVEHDPPFGRQLHSMRWIGTGDLGDVEGENPRYLRMNCTLMLRTWFMRGTWPDARREPAVHAVQREGYSEEQMAPTAAWWGTGNLWSIRDPSDAGVRAAWPTTGAAVVTTGGPGSLAMQVADPADRVELVELGTLLDKDEVQILSLAGAVTLDADVELYVDALFGDPTPRVVQTLPKVYPDPNPVPIGSSFGGVLLSPQVSGGLRVGSPVWAQPVAAGEHSFHEFVLSRGKRFVYGVRGSGAPASVELGRIDVRQVMDVARAAPVVTDGGAAWVHGWAGLDPRPYLVVVRLVNPTVAGTVLAFEDDVAAPTFSRPRTVPLSTSLGVVALIQPKVDSLRVVVPKTVIVADSYIRPFDGPYLGSTLLP